MKILRLHIKTKWLDMIDGGIKHEDYRAIKPFYDSRLTDKDYDAVEFIAGYSKTSRRSLYEFKTVKKKIGRPDWGAPPHIVYAIRLGKRLQ